jgi:hypothetical protein
MVLLLPSFGYLVLAAMFWVVAPPWIRICMVIVGVLLTVAGVFAAMRNIVRHEQERRVSSRPLDIYRWLPQWDAPQFLRHFELFLRARGWRIISASATSEDRFLVVADKTKSKCRIALLGVKPGQQAAATDVTDLDAARQDQLVTRAALVVEVKPSEQDVHDALERGILTLRFADLSTLEDALYVK